MTGEKIIIETGKMYFFFLFQSNSSRISGPGSRVDIGAAIHLSGAGVLAGPRQRASRLLQPAGYEDGLDELLKYIFF